MAGGGHENNTKDNKEYTQNEVKEFYNIYIMLNQVDNGYKWPNNFYNRYSELAKKILKKENPKLNEVKIFFNKFSANHMAGGVNPFSVLSNNNNSTEKTSLPPFVVKNLNDLPNHVNLNYNFSGVNKSDLTKQLITLIKIRERILKLHNDFSRALINKKKSEKINNTTLPSLKNTKINKSDINFANYNLQDSLARGDIEQKFYELSHFYKKINELIFRIQKTLNQPTYTQNEKNKVHAYYEAIRNLNSDYNYNPAFYEGYTELMVKIFGKEKPSKNELKKFIE